MNTNAKAEHVTRENILMLVSDDEVARVSTAETAPRLAEGDEFLDLDQLERGVQRADGVRPEPEPPGFRRGVDLRVGALRRSRRGP